MKSLSRGWMSIPVVGVILVMAAAGAHADIPTAFTYQGRLSDGGSGANGTFDFIFDLYSGMTGGTAAHTMATNNVTVTDGYFEVYLDFGDDAFTGSFWALEIRVRPHGSGAYEKLSPRQPILPTPYAMCADRVAPAGVDAAAMQPDSVLSATIKDGEVSLADLADNSVSSNQIVNGTITPADVLGGLYSSKSQLYVRTATVTVGGNAAGNATAIADDANDLPLAGSAGDTVFSGLVVKFTRCTDWTSTTEPAKYMAGFQNLTGSSQDVTVSIICVRVD